MRIEAPGWFAIVSGALVAAAAAAALAVMGWPQDARLHVVPCDAGDPLPAIRQHLRQRR